MAKGFYIKSLVAGRYQTVVRYSRSLPNDSPSTRRAKQAATAAAQKFINIKNGTERLELLLCANFDRKEACFCTFTFQEECLPANQKHARQVFTSFIRELRKEYSRSGRPLKYIYTVEGCPDISQAAPVSSDQWEIAPWKAKDRWEALDSSTIQAEAEAPARLHVHCFLLLEKEDMETVRALWRHGYVHINRMKVNEKTTFQRLAAYVTKEKRNDTKGNGSRGYIPSQNLEKPTITGHWCTEFEGITIPQGAEPIKSGAERNDLYGSSLEYVVFRLPRAQQQPQPYKSKGRLAPKSNACGRSGQHPPKGYLYTTKP